MGGNSSQRQAKSKAATLPTTFSLFGFLRHKRQQHRSRDDHGGWRGFEEVPSPRKVWPSDYDRGHYVAEPGIDRKASAFIERFHQSRVSESERHAINTN
ncbi:hypothetical protein SAY87_003380 [Trapa incisa]|uniref:Uncharacterized protein n=1 Tax=Trapa incisa TaxID=236973 RepID=A0AAN7KNK4_9MYRT|nr:hypothetical protein SAY87_003380 [Trapa incisa]